MKTKYIRSETAKLKAAAWQRQRRERLRENRPSQNGQIWAYIKTRKGLLTKAKVALDENDLFWVNERLPLPVGTNKTYYNDGGWRYIGDITRMVEFKRRMESLDCIFMKDNRIL